MALAAIAQGAECVAGPVHAAEVQGVAAEDTGLAEQRILDALVVDAQRQIATRGHVPFVVGVDAVGPLGLGIGIAAGDGLGGIKGHQIGPQFVVIGPRRAGCEAEADLHLVVEVPVDVGAGEHQHLVIGRRHQGVGRADTAEGRAGVFHAFDPRASNDVAPVLGPGAHGVTRQDFFLHAEEVGIGVLADEDPGLEQVVGALVDGVLREVVEVVAHHEFALKGLEVADLVEVEALPGCGDLGDSR